MFKKKNFGRKCLLTALIYLVVQISITGSNSAFVYADAIASRVGSMGIATPNGGSAVTNDGRFVYVSVPSNQIKKFDLVNGSLVASIPANNAGGLVISQDGSFLFAASASTNQVNHSIDQILKISTSTDQVVNTYSAAAWPTDGSNSLSLRYPLLTPDGLSMFISYSTGSQERLANLNLVTAVMTPVTLPSEISSVSCCLFIMSASGQYLYVTWQQSGSRNYISKLDIATSQLTWSRQLPTNAIPRDAVEAADGFLYVMGRSSTYDVTYIFRFNRTSGDRDSQFMIDVYESSDEHLTLVDEGWGIRFFSKALHNGEFGPQRRTTLQHIHLTNLQRTSTQVLDVEGESYGFAFAGGKYAFYNFDSTTSLGDIYSGNLQDASQTISMSPIAQQILGLNSPNLSASASSGMTVSFSSNTTNVCSISGLTVTGLSEGNCYIQASQAGGRGWGQASSNLAISFRKPEILWDSLADDQMHSKSRKLVATSESGLGVEFSSLTPTTCLVSGNSVQYVAPGECSISADQSATGRIPAANRVIHKFNIFPSSVSSSPGVSINDGNPYTNDPQVELNLAWPDFATEVRISNDGGFGASRTASFSVRETIAWKLDDSVKGAFTKVIYIKFIGKGIDSSRIYTDDIILDSTPPIITEVTSSSSPSNSSSVKILSLRIVDKGQKLLIKAKDNLSGIGRVQIKTSLNGLITSLSTPNPKAATRTINISTKKKRLYTRVVDRAGNASRWLSVLIK